jgi:hypothetical protein
MHGVLWVEGLMVAGLADGGRGSGFEVFGRRGFGLEQHRTSSSFIRSEPLPFGGSMSTTFELLQAHCMPSSATHWTTSSMFSRTLLPLLHQHPLPSTTASFSGYTTPPTSPSTRNKRHTSRPFPNADAAYYPLRRARLFPKPSGAPTRRHRVHWTSQPMRI